MIYNNNLDVLMSQIKTGITKQGLSQKQVADNMGLSTPTVSNLLNARSDNITLDTLWKLCTAAGYDLEINLVSQEPDLTSLRATLDDLEKRIESLLNTIYEIKNTNND